MRVVVQRVLGAEVNIDGKSVAKIDRGILVFVGIEAGDAQEDAEYLAQKISRMRIFSDDDGKMNCSVVDVGGQCLVVSQFTLHALTKKGNRPSFVKAARPEVAVPLYTHFIAQIERHLPNKWTTGVFGADMQVTLINDGPVTILMDSKQRE